MYLKLSLEMCEIKIKKLLYLIVIFIVLSNPLKAQNNRDSDHNEIGWYAFFANVKLDDKWSIHGEFQWRRENYLSEPQQNLIRTGINYSISKLVTFRLGYAFADTYPYGKIAIQSTERLFPEHRFYQMLSISNPLGRVVLSHRFMLEQRWVGRFIDPGSTRADDYTYLNRGRYMARLDIPLKGLTLENKQPYLAAYDEVMIGFGKNVSQNVFDQNRIGLLAGIKFSDQLRIEGGFLNQTLQFGRLVDGKNVFQYNNGFILNTYISL